LGNGGYSLSFDGAVIKTGGTFGREEVTFFGGGCTSEENSDAVVAPTPTAAPTPALTDQPTPSADSGGCPSGEVPIDVILRTDRFALESSFLITDQDGTTIWSRSNLANFQDYSFQECVAPDGCYTFTALDAFGDGTYAG
jgi:hypothetical protein